MTECDTCGGHFLQGKPWAKYCSSTCKNNARSKKVTNSNFHQGRREILNSIKVDAGCAKCGYNEHPAALQFHHAYGEKSFDVSRGPKVSRDRLIAEICKCTILCANCHSVITFNEQKGAQLCQD